MSFIEWSDEYATGIASVDNQHQKLIGIVNTLHDAIKNGQTDTVISEIIKELAAYTHFHFTLEESLMLSYNYEFFDAHKKEHEEFKKKVKDFQQKVQFGHTAISIEIINFLMDWLLHHILEVDKMFAPFLKSQGE
ncbi:MAG: bacteriohemerythrin [Syntrophothermus sp.]